MTGPENFGEEDRANDYELGTLFACTIMWLESNTPLFVEQEDDIAGTYNELPVTQHNPHYAFEIPGSVLKSVVPRATDYFDDNDTLSFLYYIPHYTAIPKYEDEDGEVVEVKYKYYRPQCSFDIEMAGEPSYGVSIVIEDVHAEDDEDTWQVQRILHTDIDAGYEIIENPEGLTFVDAEQLEKVTNISRLTRQEFNLFTEIVIKLDELKAMMPDPPLYIPEDPS